MSLQRLQQERKRPSGKATSTLHPQAKGRMGSRGIHASEDGGDGETIVSKKQDPLDEVCTKCGWHKWEHERDSLACPSAHRNPPDNRWPGGYHATNAFTPSGRFDESLSFDVKQRRREESDRY